MGLTETIRAKARADRRRIVLPEGDEQRTIAAAEVIRAEGLAEPARPRRFTSFGGRRGSPRRARRSWCRTRCTSG